MDLRRNPRKSVPLKYNYFNDGLSHSMLKISGKIKRRIKVFIQLRFRVSPAEENKNKFQLFYYCVFLKRPTRVQVVKEQKQKGIFRKFQIFRI